MIVAMPPAGGTSPLSLPAFRPLLGSSATGAFASRALAVVIGLQVYELTRDPLALGLLALTEAIPALSISLFGGWVADQFNRRSIVLWQRVAIGPCVLALSAVSLNGTETSVLALYAVVFVIGISRGFSEPAVIGLEAQLVPRERAIKATAWLAGTAYAVAMLGAACAGFTYELLGPSGTYVVIAAIYAVSVLCLMALPHVPAPLAGARGPVLGGIAEGVRFVFGHEVFLGAMCLSLFAVVCGGAMALLPLFATDILEVGASGLGLLSAAPAAGSLVVMLVSARHPPVARAGRNLLLAVAGFSLAMITLGLSDSFALSLAALVVSGMCDGVSVVIRGTLLRMLSPDGLRGRIAAVNALLIRSSNEIGALQSAGLASLLGARPAVWLSGIVTLAVVIAVAIRAPRLRQLRL